MRDGIGQPAAAVKNYQGQPSTSLRNDEPARPFGTTHRTLPAGLAAVVSDGSASPGVDGPWSLAGRLRVEAEIIGQLTGLAVITKPVSAAGDAATLVDAIGEMGAAGAIFLTDVAADRARQTQRAVADGGGPVVLTDQDATAMAVTASLLTELARAGLRPTRSRVVITGAPTAPLLRPLLIAAGIGEIDSWTAWDAGGSGLNRFVYGADAVIDLIGRASHKLHFDRAQPVIIGPGPRMDRCLSTPGLLMAILRSSARQVGIDVYHACVLTLLASTPAHRLLPQPDSDLAETIAAAALAVLQRRRQGSAAATPAPQQGTRGPPTTATPI